MSKNITYSQPISSSNHSMPAKEDLRLYRESLEDPDSFWTKQSEKYLTWDKPWNQITKSNFIKGKCEWFEGGKLNASTNCIDRHLKKKKF